MPKIKLENGFTKIANDLLEKFTKTSLSGSGWRVLIAIIRKLYGYKKKEDWISYQQLQKMTGLSKPKISSCVKQLSETGIISVTRNGNKIIIGILKNYKVLPKRIRLTRNDNEPLPETITDRYQKRELTVTRKAHLTDTTKENVTKENVTKENIQKKEYSKRENLSAKDFKEISLKYNVPISFILSKYEDICNWEDEKPGRMKGRNWKLTLYRWVKKDAIQIRKEANYGNKKRAIDVEAILSQRRMASKSG